MSRQTRVIWAAGFLDGEGCITVGRRLRKRHDRKQAQIAYVQRLSANQTDMTPLLILKELWGGFITTRRRTSSAHNPCWDWVLQGAQCKPALQEMLPYLVVKRQQAELLIEFQRLVDRARGGRHGLAKSDYAERDAIRDAISALNGRKPRCQVARTAGKESAQLRLVAS